MLLEGGSLQVMLNYDAIAAFLDSGVSMVGASADDQLVPEAFRVWGASLGDGGVLRALVSSDVGQTFERVGQGTLLCMTFTDVLNLRSIQVKGRSVGSPEPPGPADVACLERYDDALSRSRGPTARRLHSCKPFGRVGVRGLDCARRGV